MIGYSLPQLSVQPEGGDSSGGGLETRVTSIRTSVVPYPHHKSITRRCHDGKDVWHQRINIYIYAGGSYE